jgi:LysR family glycine cleavage system transcriptional activator
MQLMDQTQPLVIRVNAPPTFTMRWLIPRISAFQRRREGLEVKLTTSTSPIDFEARQYDLAIRGALQPFANMQSVPFMTETIVPICHPDLLDGGALSSPRGLEAQTLISYDTEPVSWLQWMEACDQKWGDFTHQSTLQFEQMYFALQAAIEGLGVVLVPLFLVADDIIAGRLCAPFGLYGSRQRMYYANFSSNLMAIPSMESFCEWLLKEGKDTEESIEQLSLSMGWKHG